MRCSVVASRTATCQTRALEKWVITLQTLQVLRKRVSRGIRKICKFCFMISAIPRLRMCGAIPLTPAVCCLIKCRDIRTFTLLVRLVVKSER